MKPSRRAERRYIVAAMNKMPFHPCTRCGAMTNSEHHIPCIVAAYRRKGEK